MKYLRLFENESDYTQYIGGGDDYVTPHVALIKDTDVVKYQIYEHDYTNDYLTIEALEDGLTAQLSANACEYRIDNGSWNNLSVGSNTPSINKGQTLSFKGNLTPEIYEGIGTFTISKKCNVKGNVMSLLFKDEFEAQTDLTGKNYAFYKLFYNCTNIVNSSELILPATTLSDGCYFYMFNGCTLLVTAPALPATILSSYCYSSMFSNCTSLTTAPELPATTLTDCCYQNMFQNCTTLTETPKLQASILTQRCYASMFSECNGLNRIIMLATDISANSCLYEWVYGVASNGTFVKHKDMTSLRNSDSGIPKGWTVETF